ncbi:MAG: thioesterase family protein [Syntrophales bacterium]|jgi:acyl-CoA thioester hydrolase
MSECKRASHEIEHCVAFYELDPMQIVWHGNYFQYFEDARRGLLEKHGINLYVFYDKYNYLFPVIKTSSKYIYPLRYGDEFVCKATLMECKMTLVVDFEIRLKKDGKICARGRTEQVTVKMPEMEIMFTIPQEIRTALKC